TCEVTFFSEILARSREVLTTGANVLVTVDLRLEDETLRITASDVTTLDEAASGVGAGMRVAGEERGGGAHPRPAWPRGSRQGARGAGAAARRRSERGNRLAGRVQRVAPTGAGIEGGAGGGAHRGGVTRTHSASILSLWSVI